MILIAKKRFKNASLSEWQIMMKRNCLNNRNKYLGRQRCLYLADSAKWL